MEGGRAAGRTKLLRHRTPDPRGQSAGVPFLLRTVPVRRHLAGRVGAPGLGGDGAAAEVVAARAEDQEPSGAQARPTRAASRRPAVARRRRHVRRSEEHTSELQSLMRISYAVFCLNKKTTTKQK